MAKTHCEFVTEVFNLVGNEFEVLTTYEGVMSKIKIKHNPCGNIHDTTPNSFLNRRTCPICALKSRNENQIKTHEEFLKEVFELVGEEYEVLSDYLELKKY